MLIFSKILIAYLIGSIPTAFWVGSYFHGIDIREHGSKNAGATNTFRVLGKKSGWFVLIVDILKGVAASTAFAFAPKAHPANSGTTIEISVGNDFTLVGTADANYAATDNGVKCGIDDTTPAIDLGDGSPELVIMNGTVGSKDNVEVRIYAPIF
jgi:hypothetical protein